MPADLEAMARDLARALGNRGLAVVLAEESILAALREVQAEEREACAKVVDGLRERVVMGVAWQNCQQPHSALRWLAELAAAIRERGRG